VVGVCGNCQLRRPGIQFLFLSAKNLVFGAISRSRTALQRNGCHWSERLLNVSYGSKPDVRPRSSDVRFTSQSGHWSMESRSLLWAKTRLMHSNICAWARATRCKRLWTRPIERNVLARIRRPLKLEAKRINRTHRRFAPSHKLSGSGLRAGRVHELRIFSG
jgi:hypothetical protein